MGRFHASPAGTPRGGKESRRPEKQVPEDTRDGGQRRRFFWQQRGLVLATAALSLKIWWRRPPVGGILFGVKNRRYVTSIIKMYLQTIQPNPGPGLRNKTEEGKQARRERRKARRQEKKKKKESTQNVRYNITT